MMIKGKFESKKGFNILIFVCKIHFTDTNYNPFRITLVRVVSLWQNNHVCTGQNYEARSYLILRQSVKNFNKVQYNRDYPI